MVTKVDGIPVSGALPPAPSGFGAADPEAQQKFNDAIAKVLSTIEKPRDIPWFKISQALAEPGRTGHWSEGFGRAMGVLGKEQEAEEARALPVAQMRAQLAGQQLEVGNKQRAFGMLANMMGFPDAQTAAKALQTGNGLFGLGSKFTPDAYAAMAMVDPKIADVVKNAAGMDVERYKAMIEATKMNMTIAQMYDQFGKDVTDRFMRLQGGMTPGQGGPSAQTVQPPAGQPRATGKPPAAAETPQDDVTTSPYVVRDADGNVIDIKAQPDPDTNKPVVIQGQPITRPSSDASAPKTDAVQAGVVQIAPNKYRLLPSNREIVVPENYGPKDIRDFIAKELQVDQEIFKKAEELALQKQAEASSKRGESFQKKYDTVAGFDYNTVQTNELKNRELIQLVKDHQDVVGQLVHQGPIYALLQAAESGITTPMGSLSVPVTEAMNKITLNPEKQAVARNIIQLMSDLNQSIMRAGKDIYGPQISAYDAQEMAKPGFKSTDPMSFIVYLASKNLITNKYMGEMAEAQQDYFDKNPKASTSSFFSSKNKSYTDIVDRYGATMRDLVANSPYRKK